MLCVKAEGFFERTNNDELKHEEHHKQEKREECEDLYSQAPFSPLKIIGNTIQRYLIKQQASWKSRLSVSDATSSSVSGTSSSGVDFVEQDAKVNGGQSGEDKNDSMQIHISRLEVDIKTMQRQLDEEINLHLALATASDNSTKPFSNPFGQLPDEARDLLADINMLEITIGKLEEELIALQFQLSQERNERRLIEYHLRNLPASSLSPLNYTSVSPEIARPSNTRGGMTLDDLLVQENVMEWNKHSYLENLRQHPNQLSEEMTRCMRNIFLCLADSSKSTSSRGLTSPASPQGHLSYSSIASPSDSPSIPTSKQSLSFDLEHVFLGGENTFDPYRIPGKFNWAKYIGAYSVAAEVSWMSVGEKQLEYAAGALKRFRLLVEQLAKANPSCMNTNERLAFWINLYNTLIMHAYLAYGVPSSDSKFFSLMKKVEISDLYINSCCSFESYEMLWCMQASYTVGGLSLSAADIEYIILKMKPPAHRPHMALVLGLHKFKLPEEKRMYSIDNSEPLVAFALSCGMHSSPAVRIFRPENVMAELQTSLKDYIRASVGISSKGKLIVPKLLHSYTKGIVEDSMLPEWICRFLSPEQTAMVRDCSSHSKQRLLSPRSFMVQPFDSRFRYLFLPESTCPPRCINEEIDL